MREQGLPLVPPDRDRVVRVRVRVVGDLEEVGDRAETEVARSDAELGLHVAADLDGGQHERGPVQDCARGRHPGIVRMRRPEEGEGGVRGVRLLDVDEPSLPFGPHLVDLGQALEPPVPPDHLQGGRRRSRADLERRDADLATREGAVERRQVGDQQRQQEQAEGRLDEDQGGRDHVLRSGEPEREQRRARQVEGRQPALLFDRPEDHREPQQDQGEPGRQRGDQGDGGVRTEAPIPAPVVHTRPRDQTEDPAERDEHRPRDPRGRRAGQDHRLDRGADRGRDEHGPQPRDEDPERHRPMLGLPLGRDLSTRTRARRRPGPARRRPRGSRRRAPGRG